MLELITASFTAPLYQARNSRLKNNEVIINIPIEGPTAKAVNKFVKELEKKGFKKEARNVAYTYMSTMRKFHDYLNELVDKLM